MIIDHTVDRAMTIVSTDATLLEFEPRIGAEAVALVQHYSSFHRDAEM